MLKRIFLIVAAIFSIMAAKAQVVINPDDPIISDQPVKIANNGRTLTKQGLSLLHYRDLTNVYVKRDSLILSIKPEALKQLDANEKANYEPIGKSAKKSKKARENAPKKDNSEPYSK